jgi:hypothetical protein
LYVTLNYDTLFDNRLTTYGRSRITAMDDYIAPSRNWALLKLHGSINWAKRVQPGLPADRFSIITTQEYLEIVDGPETLELSEAIELRSHADLMRMRCDGGRDVYYRLYQHPWGPKMSCRARQITSPFSDRRLSQWGR